jgi:putative hydrolase of the HAD superfamily
MTPFRHRPGFGRRLLPAAGALPLLLALGCLDGQDGAAARVPPKAEVIKAVILDIGNVMVDVDLAKAEPAFRAAGLPVTRNLLGDPDSLALVRRYSEGAVDTRAFMARFARLQGRAAIPAHRFARAWNAMVPALRTDAIEAVPEFRARGYRLFALSDNNALHTDHIRRLFRERYPDREFLGLFDKCYLSQVTGHTKASDAAWRDVLDEQGLQAQECLFVDDHQPNIARARNLGFQVFHFTPGTPMEKVLAALADLEHGGRRRGAPSGAAGLQGTP